MSVSCLPTLAAATRAAAARHAACPPAQWFIKAKMPAPDVLDGVALLPDAADLVTGAAWGLKGEGHGVVSRQGATAWGIQP